MKDILTRIASSTSFKFVVIGVLSLILLIPVGQIRSLVTERQERSTSAALEISEKWGLDQTITGPYLTLQLKETRTFDSRVEHVRKNLHILPDDLLITGNVVPEEKKRGIYNTVVYQAGLSISGEIRIPEGLLEQIQEHDIINNSLYVCLGISDLRGIKDLTIKIGGEVVEEMPGLPSADIAPKGIHIPLALHWLNRESLPFDIELKLDGSRELRFIPVGKTTRVDISSSWADPSFDGAFLPTPAETETGADGFHAIWLVNYLNRSYPQHWFDAEPNLEDSAFGVYFLIPVDHYQKSMRSIKYALMFIALTFLIFFLTEIISGIRLHPIQYLLVGMALVVFYTLLISLSEHLGFNPAFLISSIATVLLVSFYVSSSTRRIRQGLITGFLLLVLYAFLFITLQLQDYSLLFGSVGIFAVIAVIMYVSRKVNWYREGQAREEQEAGTASPG